MAKPYLSIIIPAYNEAERIPETLLDMDKRLEAAPFSYEIIVVNDGSSDNTAEVVENLKPAVRNLKVIDNSDNHGKGSAVRQGMLLAGGTVRLFADADNSTTIDHFDYMLEHFKNGYDVVIGSRAVKGAKLDPAEPFIRKLAGSVGGWGIRIVLGLRAIKDTQCGFKAFTEEAAKKVFGISRISGWGFDPEILALASRAGLKIKEVPVLWRNDERSHVKFSSYFGVLKDVYNIKMGISRGIYDDELVKAAGLGESGSVLDENTGYKG